jgi:hypothetical protein
MKPVPLSNLIEALDFDSDEEVTRVDTQEGDVVRISSDVLSAIEGDDTETLEGLPDWQREEVEIARAIADDTSGRFVKAPNKFEFHEYRHMERFIGTVEDDQAAEQLWRAIKGKGAFRYFKDTAARFDLLDRWYRYRDDALKQFAIEWAEAQKIPVVNDSTD